MIFPDNVRTALQADLNDMISWSCLLNFFSNFQSELSLPEKILIYERCEDFRIFWNTDRVETTEQISHSGRKTNQTKIRQSLNIDKNNVYPNHIYTDQDILDHLQTRTPDKNFQLNNNKPAKESRRADDLFEQGSALAI